MKKTLQSRDPYGLRAGLRTAGKIAVVGIGSDLRGDDVAGLLVIRALRKAFARSLPSAISLFEGGSTPENLTGEILKFKPSHLLLIDAAALGLKPGAVQRIEPDDIGGVSFSTHSLPLNVMTDYLKQSLPCNVIMLGIQPKQTGFGDAPSREVVRAAHRLAQEIRHAAQETAGRKTAKKRVDAEETRGVM